MSELVDGSTPALQTPGSQRSDADASADSASSAFGEALFALGQWLLAMDYGFTAVTPETHQRVLRRAPRAAPPTLRDAFGWNRPFGDDLLPPALLGLCLKAGLIERLPNGRYHARVRWACAREALLAHGAFPTVAADSVFFGPDTYRFINLIEQELRGVPAPVRYIVDIGCGSGAGGLMACRAETDARLVLADINPTALRHAAVNARLMGVNAECVHSDVFAAIDGAPDFIVANPPYMADAAARTYRDGGGERGSALSLRILDESLRRLAPGGTLVLYTGSAIVEGEDRFRRNALALLHGHAGQFHSRYTEIDPDVFGEELALDGYRDVDRIAAVSLVVRRFLPGQKDLPA